MIIFFLTAPFIICAVICFLQTFIHETGHYLKIKQWAKILKFKYKGTEIFLGDINSKQLFKIGVYRIMAKDTFKKGLTVSPFYKQLALFEGRDKYGIIRDNAAAGAKAVLLTGFIMLYILQAAAVFNTSLFNPFILAVYIPLTVAAAVFICFAFKNSFGAGGENSDLLYWRNPQKFIDYFKE